MPVGNVHTLPYQVLYLLLLTCLLPACRALTLKKVPRVVHGSFVSKRLKFSGRWTVSSCSFPLMHAQHTRSEIFLITLRMPLACALCALYDRWNTLREQQAEWLPSITCRDGPDETYKAVQQSSPQLHLCLSSCPSDVSNNPPSPPAPPAPPQSLIPSCHCCASLMRCHCAADSAVLPGVYLSPRLFMHGFICLLIWIQREIKHMRAFPAHHCLATALTLTLSRSLFHRQSAPTYSETLNTIRVSHYKPECTDI